MREQETEGSRPAYSEYFKQNICVFDALDFIAELTQNIPPKRLQIIRRQGLYASRTKRRPTVMPWVAERAPDGWKATYPTSSSAEDLGYESMSMLASVHGPDYRRRCMRVIAIIEDHVEITCGIW